MMIIIQPTRLLWWRFNMKVKPKEVLLNLPTVIMFGDYHEIPNFASNINQVLHGKVKVKYEELGQLAGQYVGLFYLQRNDEFDDLRMSFRQMIEREEMKNSEPVKYNHNTSTPPNSKFSDPKLTGKWEDPATCNHSWVLDGHNAGEPICSKCLARE